MASLFCGHYELVDADANVGNVLGDAFSSELTEVRTMRGKWTLKRSEIKIKSA